MRRSFNKYALLWGVTATCFIGIQPTQAQMGMPMPLPGFDINVSETARDVFGQMIIRVYRIRSEFAKHKQEDDPAGYMPKMVFMKGKKRMKFSGVSARAVAANERYCRWVMDQEYIGDNAKAMNQFLRFPAGHAIIMQPAMMRNMGIRGMLASIDGAGTSAAGCFIRGVGWCAAFSPGMLPPGTKEGMCIVFDHAKDKKIRLLTMPMGHKIMKGQQFEAYQFMVTEPVDMHGNPFNIYDLTYEQLVQRTMGLMPIRTLIQPPLQQPLEGGPQVIEGQRSTGRDAETVRDPGNTGNALRPNRDNSRERTATRPNKIMANVTLVDSKEDYWTGDVTVTIHSFAEENGKPGEELAEQKGTASGPSEFEIETAGNWIGVIVHMDGFEPKMQPGQKSAKLDGRTIILQKPDEFGKTNFVFKFKGLQAQGDLGERTVALRPNIPPVNTETGEVTSPNAVVYVWAHQLPADSMSPAWMVGGNPKVQKTGKLTFVPSADTPGLMKAELVIKNSSGELARPEELEIMLDKNSDDLRWKLSAQPVIKNGKKKFYFVLK